MLTVLTGPYRDLEHALANEVVAAKRADPMSELLVISPSGQMLTRLQQILADRQSAVLNVHFLSFYGLAERLAFSEPSSDQVVTEPALYVEAIRQLLEGQSDVEFILRQAFRPAGAPLSKGLPGALSATLRDLRDSGARVVDTLKVALEGHLGEEAGEAAPTLELYARLYEVLQKHGLRTSADQLRRAAAQIPSHPFIKKQKKIFLYGFYDLTGVQLDFVLAFANHAAQVYCPYRADDPTYSYADRLLKDPAFTTKVKTVRAAAPSPATRVTPEVWNTSGTQDEAWLVAKKLLARHEEGVAYRDILVSARSLGPYVPALREALETHHIPYSMRAEEPVGAYPLIKTARQLLALLREDFPIGPVFDVLKSPYFSVPVGLGELHPSAAMQIARQAGITSGWENWEERLQRWADQDPPAEFLEAISATYRPEQARQCARELLDVMRSLKRHLGEGLEAPAPWSDHAAWAKRVIEHWLRLSADAVPDEQLLWKGLLDTCTGLATLDALARPIARERFLEVWEDRIDHLALALAPENTNGVQVIDVMAARGLSFDTVIILGMNEKSFPRLIREDPFLSDKARGALAQALGCRLQRKFDGYQEERLLFQLAIEMATQKLFLTYQRSDEEGKALVPSLYLHEAVASFEPHHLPRTLREKWKQVPGKHLTPKEVSILWNREGLDPSAIYQAVGYDRPLFDWLRGSQLRLESFSDSLGPYDGVIGPRPELKAVFERGFSADSLQDLAECPFRYFAGKVLGLEDSSGLNRTGDLAADAEGKLIHRILETFYGRLKGHKGPLTPEVLREELDNACNTCFQAFQDTAADLYPVAWQATQQTIRTRLQVFLAVDTEELHENGFIPMFFEETIEGPIAEIPDLQGVKFHGRVDRIDVRKDQSAHTYRVVDYKTGRPSSAALKTETAVLRGRYLQLPIYLSLVKPWLEKKLGTPARPASASFYNLADWERGTSSPELGPDFWNQCGTLFAQNLQGLLALVQDGTFYIRPGEDQPYCHWCDFSSICRKEHKPTAFRSERSTARLANDERLRRAAP